MRPTAPLLGRLRKLHLTTKNVNQGWHYADYNKVGLLGDWDPKTKRFQPDWSKVRTYVLPQDSYWKGHEYQMKWDGPELTPFVTKKASQHGKYENVGGDQWIVPPKKLTGEKYKELWEESGGHDEIEVYSTPKANSR